MALKFDTTTRNNILTAINDRINAGTNKAVCVIYSGTRPAGPGTAISGNTKLAQLTFSDPAGTVSSGVLTMAAITQDTSADATGTASWFRIYWTNDGATYTDPTNAVVDGDVATSGADLNLNTTSIVAGGPVQISSWTMTAPGA